jgi:hypothetical protein
MADSTITAEDDFGRLHPEAFAAGRAAFQAGASRRSNPIKNDQERRLAWYWGYSDAQNETIPDDEPQPTVTVSELVEHLTRLYPGDAHVHLTEAEHRSQGSAPVAVCLNVALKHIRGTPKGNSI